jgi:acetyl-CoA synthetase
MTFNDYPAWQWQIPTHFNIGEACTDAHLNTTIAEHIAMIVEDDACGTTQITFAELAKRTDQFASLIQSLGVKAGDRVLIRLPNSLDYPITFLGAMKSGAIAVPTSTLLTPEEVAYLAKDSGARVLVTDKAAWQALSEALSDTSQIPNLDTVLLTSARELALDDFASINPHLNLVDLHNTLPSFSSVYEKPLSLANDPAYLVYTSGTTGYPKGVLHAHRALLGRKPASQYWFDFSRDQSQSSPQLLPDRIMHSGKFNWTYVLGSGLMDPLYLGKTVIVHEGKNDADLWTRLIAKHQATVFVGVPTIYRQIIQKSKATRADVPSLRHCMSAGEHLSDEVLQQWRERFGVDIYEAVGMSEFSYYLSQSIYRPIRAGSAGFPQPGHAIRLLDPVTLTEVTTGEEGMICVPDDDPGLFLRYWNLDEETAKYKHDGYFFTGDYARYDEDGYIWFLGRKDDIIKSFGYRVSPYEIERVYKSHPAVADCAAVAEELEKDKVLVVVYVILQAAQSTSADELYQFGKAHLAAYKAPKTVYLTHDFPRTKNGKILRKDIQNTIAYAKSER